MRDNVKHFLRLLTEALEPPGPVVEVGALQTETQESYADMRPFFGGRAYLGCDMQAGPGVDCRADAHRLPFRDGSVGTLLLLDTLEHLHSPVVAVEEACRAAREEGVVVLASVMNFAIHSFPSDYWRFTPAAFDYLLQPLATRVVLAQGDAEFPHTVLGVGTKAAAGDACERLRAAVADVQARWPETMAGGPFLVWDGAVVALAQRAADRALPPLVRGRRLEQGFVCPSDHLCRIDVRLTSEGRPRDGHLLFRLRDAAGEEVAAYRLFAAHAVDGGWTFVPLPPQQRSAKQRYSFSIESPDADAGHALAPLAGSEALSDGHLSVDGQPVEGTLCFQVLCRTEEPAPLPRLETGVRRAAAPPSPDGVAELLARAEEQRWQQVRYLASVIEAGFDGLQAELKTTQTRLDQLARVQQRALDQSTEAAALVRGIKRTPVYRVWRRFLRNG